MVADLDDSEQELLLALIQESLSIRNHFGLFQWLQGKLQTFLPHQIMIAAWGDFSLGLIYFDIVSSLPGFRTQNTSHKDLSPLLKRMFSDWLQSDKKAFIMNIEPDNLNGMGGEYKLIHENFINMNSSVIHGIKDQRGHHDCLYILMNELMIPINSIKILEALLPYIDCALRQVEHLPEQLPKSHKAIEELAEMVTNTLLSIREIEIMDWVKKGKTNVEIGLILDISEFTVKNHLQRIFKKLDVSNRAQAVSHYKKKSKN